MPNKFTAENEALLQSALELLDVEQPTARDWARLELLYSRYADNLDALKQHIDENMQPDTSSVVIRVDGQAVKFQDETALAEYLTSVME